MRLAPTFAVSSWLLVLLGIGLDLGTCHAQAKDSFDDDPPGTTEYVKEFAPILGRGINLKDAEQDALRKAKRLLDEFLRTLEPRLEWSPSLAYIQQALLKGAPERQESKDETVSGVEVKCWSWKLALSERDWQSIHKQNRNIRVGQRMIVQVKFLAAILAVLGAIAGYIRLDDWTKGYYTGRLQLGALAVLGAATSLLWWLS